MDTPLIDSARNSGARSPAPAVGAVIAGRYRLDRAATPTPAGAVFEATDRQLSRRVELEIASEIDEVGRAEWSRDASRGQRLEGEHVLRILDHGALADGTPYLVREVGLTTLAAEVEARGAIPMEEAVGWTLEACEAVAEAHALGMAHGDLRLENLWLARGPRGPVAVKVAWPASAPAHDADRNDVGHDIASLGAVLRALVTGRTDEEAAGAPTLPSPLALAVARAEAQGSESAFRNVSALSSALAPFAPPGHRSAQNSTFILSRAGIVSAVIPDSRRRSSVRARSAHRLTFPWSRRGGGGDPRSDAPTSPRTLALALFCAAVIGFALGGSWLVWRGRDLRVGPGAAPPAPVSTTEVTGAALDVPATRPSATATAPPPVPAPAR